LLYRILYFFHALNIVIVAHAIIKEGSAVPDIDINRPIERQQLFVADPKTHTYEEEESDVEN
jgi:phage-related protein